MSGFASIARNTGGGAGGANTANASSTTQFGETLVAQLTPAAQATFVHGLSTINFITRSIGENSSLTSSSGSAFLQSGISSTGSATIQMRRGLTYRPGQGSLCRLTSIFGPPVADTYQLCGLGNVESGFYFGYQGIDFGVHHFTGARREVRTLTIPVGGVANGTAVTVTLNGESKIYTIDGGNSRDQTSWEIAYQDWTNVGGGWVTEAYDGTIYFISLRTGARTGSYSTSIAGSSFSQYIAGSNLSSNFISQSNWNIDTMDGNGPSRMLLDKTKGNVYQIGFQYLGYGNTRFAIEDPQTGQFQSCHMIHQANSRLTPVLNDPHVAVTWEVFNSGSTTSTHMTGASGAVFCEGEVLRNIGPAFSATAFNSDVDTAEEPILTIRSNRIFRGKVGYGELDISTLSVSIPQTAAAHYVTIRIYKNLRLSGPVNFTNVNVDQSIASYDTSATGFTANQNTLVSSFVIPFGGSINADLKGDNFFLSVGESLTITAQASTTNASAACAITWFEDQ